MTRSQAARRLGVAKTTVRRLEGTELTPIRAPNGTISFEHSDVEDYAKRRAKTSSRSPSPSPLERESTLENALAVFDLLDQGRSGLEIVRALSLHPDIVEKLIAQRLRLLGTNGNHGDSHSNPVGADGSSRADLQARDSTPLHTDPANGPVEAAPIGSASGTRGFSRAGGDIADAVSSQMHAPADPAAALPQGARDGAIGSSRASDGALVDPRGADEECDSAGRAHDTAGAIEPPAGEQIGLRGRAFEERCDAAAAAPTGSARGNDSSSAGQDVPDGAAAPLSAREPCTATPRVADAGLTGASRADADAPSADRARSASTDSGDPGAVDPPREYEVFLAYELLDEELDVIRANPVLDAKLRKDVDDLRRTGLCFDEIASRFRIIARAMLAAVDGGSATN